MECSVGAICSSTNKVLVQLDVKLISVIETQEFLTFDGKCFILYLYFYISVYPRCGGRDIWRQGAKECAYIEISGG